MASQANAVYAGGMKWLFRIIGVTLVTFIAICVGGYFLPAKQSVDATATIKADRDVIYEVLIDLRSYPEWSGIGGPDSKWVFGGASGGTGQTAAWQSGGAFGSIEILQSSPGEFVLVKTIGPLGQQRVTLALQEMSVQSSDDVTTGFLIEAQRDLGGFPYFSRIASLRQGAKTRAALERSTTGLKLMTETTN